MPTYKKIDEVTVEIKIPESITTKDLTQFQTELQTKIDELTQRITDLQSAQESYTAIIQATQKLISDLQSQIDAITRAKVGEDVSVAVALDATAAEIADG